MEIINVLMDQLGVNENQAKGGAGAIFNLVKDKISDGDFSQLSAAVPGIATLNPKSRIQSLRVCHENPVSLVNFVANKVYDIHTVAFGIDFLGGEISDFVF